MSTVNGFQVGSEILKYNYESLDSYNTPNFSTSSSTAYAVGDYVMYNGKLYKCKTATTGGTWVSGNWDLAVLSDDVADLSRQLSDETTGLDTKAPVIVETASGAIASFDDGADGMPIRKLVAKIEPVQSGTGDPSPDNVRPISGWTGANISQAGNDFFKFDGTIPFDSGGSTVTKISDDSFSVVGKGSKEKYPASRQPVSLYQLTVGKKYRLSAHVEITTGMARFGMRNSQDTMISGADTRNITENGDYSFVFVYATDMTNLCFFSNFNATGGNVTYSSIRFEEVEEIPINWETEAGTIYGGTVTLNEDGSADVVRKYGLKTISASDNISGNAPNGYMSMSSAGMRSGNHYWDANVKCNIMEKVDGNYSGHPGIRIGAGDKTVYFYRMNEIDATLTTTAAIKAWLVENGCCFTFPLATPTTYHFDNIGQLFTFYGANNFWIDTGAITECDYPADTKLFLTARDEEITGNIAPIENGTTASKAYVQGAYFWHDTKFCKALTAIASGATFTLGTNYQETTVAAELLAAQN